MYLQSPVRIGEGTGPGGGATSRGGVEADLETIFPHMRVGWQGALYPGPICIDIRVSITLCIKQRRSSGLSGLNPGERR